MVDSLTRIISQTVLDVQHLQAENVSGAVTVEFAQANDYAQVTDIIDSGTGLVRDSFIANLSRCNHENPKTSTYDFLEAIHVGTTESAGTISLSSTPSTGSFFGAWETYCGSWHNFYWSGTTPANTSISSKILDASGNAVLIDGSTSTSYSISGISVLRQVRPMFILSSSQAGQNPNLGEYRFTYSGSRVGDYGDQIVL